MNNIYRQLELLNQFISMSIENPDFQDYYLDFVQYKKNLILKEIMPEITATEELMRDALNSDDKEGWLVLLKYKRNLYEIKSIISPNQN